MKITKNEINILTDSQLLKCRLKDLDLKIEDLLFSEQMSNVIKEMKSRGLDFPTHFWLSTEWFCPDDSGGIAIPFYLCHPRLLDLEKKLLGFADGATPHSFIKTLRHEFGHVIDNVYKLRRAPGREDLFGSSKLEYPFDYDFKLYSRAYVRNLEHGYAQSHPDEDFAETFAVWLRGPLHWKKKYAGTPAFKKLRWLNKQIHLCQKRSFHRLKTFEMASIRLDHRTLEDYYAEKKRYFRLNKFNAYNKGLRKWARKDPVKTRAPRSTLRLDGETQKIESFLAQNLKMPRYKIRPLLKDLISHSQNLGYQLQPRHPDLEPKFKAYLLKTSELLIDRGHHRLIL